MDASVLECMEVDDVFDVSCDGSSSEDSDLPSLPTYLCVTPKNVPGRHERDDTPPLQRQQLDPPLTPSSSFTISPIHFHQQRDIKSYEQENKRENILLEKSRGRILNIKERKDRKDTISNIVKSGGILEISKQTEEHIDQVKQDITAIPEKKTNEPDLHFQYNNREVHIPKVPGIPFFKTPPTFLKKFLPFPPVTNPSLLSKVASEIQNFTTIHQLMFIVNGKECPKSVVVWLMENSCLSEDIVTRQIACNTVARIVSISSSLSSPLCIQDFFSILSKLGANCNLSMETQNSINDSDLSPTDLELFLNSVSNFCKSLLVLFEKFGSIHCDRSLIRDLVLTLLSLVLDPLICSDHVCNGVTVCLHLVINTATNEDWPSIEQEIVSRFKSISNHHNCQFVVTLLSSFSSRISLLQRCLARSYLTKYCPSAENEVDKVSDHKVASCAVQHYILVQNIAYDELFSTMKILAIFIQPPRMKWTGKNNFVNLLSKLANCVKDRVPGVVMERGPVKDFIIGLKLDLQHNKDGETKQTTLFNYVLCDENEVDSQT